jgi:hypothetical protein
MDPNNRQPGTNLAWIVSLVALAIALFVLFRSGRNDLTRIENPTGMLREIRLLKELVTIRYSIQKVAGLTEDTKPFGSESILLIMQAKVMGGIDLAEMSEQDVRVKDRHSVTVLLPAPQILHIYIDENKTKVWDRTKTWWTPWIPSDNDLEKKARLAGLDAVKQEALDMGILQDAQSSAETLIRGLLRPLGFEHVEFVKRKS